MPYDLKALSPSRTKSFRVIKPTSTQEAEMLRLYMPILTAWRNSAAISVSLYAQGQSNEQQDDNTHREVMALLGLIRWRSFFEKLETWHRDKWIANVKAATGVDAKYLATAPTVTANMGYRMAIAPAGGVVASARATATAEADTSVASTIDAAIKSAADLAKSLSDEAQNRINQALNAGRRTGASTTDVARQINEGLAKSRRRAIGIADNEVDNAVKGMTRSRMQEASLDEAFWQHNTLKNYRPEHLARDGMFYKLSDPVWASQMLPNCRCQAIPRLS